MGRAGVEGVSFYEVATAGPERIAFPGPGEPVTYGALHAEVNRLSHAFAELGLGFGDAVATVLANRTEFLSIMLAAMQSGLYLIPVSRHLTAPEISYVLADSGTGVVITERAFAGGAVAAEELAAALLAHCEPRLARIKHPRRIEFRASLPRTPSGKLSRSRVRDDYLRESGDQGEQPVG